MHIPTFAVPSPDWDMFCSELHYRLQLLSEEAGQSRFVIPIGLFLVVDEANGGDQVAQEVIRRFHLLNLEPRDIIDYYFLGWDREVGLRFDLQSFHDCRTELQRLGIERFGGNADLILLDAHFFGGVDHVVLDFPKAVHIDLSQASAEKVFPTLGGFLQGLIDAARDVRDSPPSALAPTFYISDRLGLAIAKRSILNFVFEKLGKLIGARELASVAVRRSGPPVLLSGWSGEARQLPDWEWDRLRQQYGGLT